MKPRCADGFSAEPPWSTKGSSFKSVLSSARALISGKHPEHQWQFPFPIQHRPATGNPVLHGETQIWLVEEGKTPPSAWPRITAPKAMTTGTPRQCWALLVHSSSKSGPLEGNARTIPMACPTERSQMAYVSALRNSENLEPLNNNICRAGSEGGLLGHSFVCP